MSEPAAVPGGVEVPNEWRRMHPLSPVIRLASATGGVLLIVGVRAAAASGGGGAVIGDAGLLGIVGVLGLVSWLVTRWRVQGSELQIESGLLRRQSIRLPLSRIQSIDVVRPLLARVFGLAELRVQVAGRGQDKGRLTYLREDEATALRGRLLALAHGVAPDTPAPAGRPLFAVDNKQIVAATVLGAPLGAFLAFAVSSVVVSVVASPAAASSLLALSLAAASAVWRRLNADFSFSVAEAPDGLRISTGLLTTRHETIPSGRVQAVRWREPLLWRPFGWCRLEVDVAQQRARSRGGDSTDSAALDRALLPVGTADQARALLARVFPEITPEDARRNPSPRRALLRAPLSQHFRGMSHTPWYAVAASGRIRAQYVIVPLAKVQSFRLVQGPWARALGLASVHLDLVGKRWRMELTWRKADEARHLLEQLAADARRVRHRVPADRGQSVPTS